MDIPPEIQALIPQIRAQYPQLVNLPDEAVAELILQAMQEQEPPSGEQDMQSMSAEELRSTGQQLLNTGRWQEAEQYYLLALEKSEKDQDYYGMAWAFNYLGRLCRDRGDFSQAMLLYQQALGDGLRQAPALLAP